LPLPAKLSADPPNFNAVFWNASNDVWIAGDNGNILHWDGTVLKSIETRTHENLMGIWSSGPGEAWAVGDNSGIWHYSGTEPAAYLQSGALSGLYGVHGNVHNGQVDVAFVGNHGTILRYRP
jgi:hypothetical protein